MHSLMRDGHLVLAQVAGEANLALVAFHQAITGTLGPAEDGKLGGIYKG